VGRAAPARARFRSQQRLGQTSWENHTAGLIGRYTAADFDDESRSHGSGELELNLVVSGTANYAIDAETYRVSGRSLIWIFPEQEQARLEPSEDFQAWFVKFRPELLAQACRSPAYEALRERRPEGTFCRKLSKAAAKRLDAHCSALSLPGLDVAHLNAGLAYLLLSGWSEFQKAADEKEASGLHPAVEKAARILRAEPATGSLNQLAKTCGASASWLSRLFRQQMSISLVEYRNHCRIERFFELYRRGQPRNIAQTAAEAGFGSYAQFHRVFRKKVGYGPAELRRRLQTDSPREDTERVPLRTSA
jgi:AraC-like DNA-binding protein